MKPMINVLVCLATLSASIPALARNADESSVRTEKVDLSTFERADLEIHLSFWKLYLAELEKNDRVMERFGLPAARSAKRSTYALFTTVTHGGLLAATYALVKPLYRRNQIEIASPYMKRANVTHVQSEIGRLRGRIAEIERNTRLAIPTAHAQSNLKLISDYQRSLGLELKDLRRHRVNAGLSEAKILARGAAIGMGLGFALTVAWDAGVAYFQVAHDGADIEAKKRHLRDLIGEAQDRLAAADSSNQAAR